MLNISEIVLVCHKFYQNVVFGYFLINWILKQLEEKAAYGCDRDKRIKEVSLCFNQSLCVQNISLKKKIYRFAVGLYRQKNNYLSPF